MNDNQTIPETSKKERHPILLFSTVAIATLVLAALAILRIRGINEATPKDPAIEKRFSVMFPFIRDREYPVLYDAVRKEGWILNEDTKRTLRVGPLLADAQKESLARLGIKEERLHLDDVSPPLFERFEFRSLEVKEVGEAFSVCRMLRILSRNRGDSSEPKPDDFVHNYLVALGQKPGDAPSLTRKE